MFLTRRKASLDDRLALAVYQKSPDAIVLIQNGVITACNAAGVKMYDAPMEKIMGQNPVVFSAPVQIDGRSSAENLADFLGKAQREGYSRFEWINLNSRGKEVRLLVTMIPADIDDPSDILALVQNLDESSKIMRSLETALVELANRNLTIRLTEKFRPDYEALRTSFNTMAGAMDTAMTGVLQTGTEIYADARDIDQAANDLSRRTEQQAASLEESAAAMHEITETIQETARSAATAKEVAVKAQEDAQTSVEIVSRTMNAMNGIERSSAEIGDIIAVIDGIAFQTNLLALNAGVEAARAGDAGKGFAVVANEVRALALRSAEAAKDVKSKISASVTQVDSGVKLVSETGEALARIARQIEDLSGLVKGIASAADQQATGIQQVSIAIGEMDSVTQQNAAMVEQTTAAVRGLVGRADTMAQDVASFAISAGPAVAAGGVSHGNDRVVPISKARRQHA